MSETTNLPEGGSESATSLSLEDAVNLDFYDPGEDTEETEAEQTSEQETEAEEAHEATETAEDDDTAEAEDEGPDDETDKPEPEDDVTVTVNGEKIPLKDLKAGYMRTQDYTRKTQEVAQRRRDLEAMTARVTNTVTAIADYLVSQIPEPPNPQLAMTNPGEFVQRKALYEAAVAQVNQLLVQAGEAKQVAQELTAQQRAELLQQEFAKLSEAFPSVATEDGRRQFFEDAAAAARELGYTDEEIKSVMDHRMFKLAHYAMLGMKAEKAKEKARAKVQNAPPVAPQKRQKSAEASRIARNREAMKRLERTGSIYDALAIDFD